MIFPDIDPVLFQIGPLSIRWYALAYIFGILFGWWYVLRTVGLAFLWPEEQPPLSRQQVNDLIFWVVLGVLLGGRIGYMLFYAPELLVSEPVRIFAVWQGGMSFHGGLLGVVAAMVVFSRLKSVPLLSLADAGCIPVPLGLLFGRLANFVNGELWGRPTDVAWGIIFPRAGDIARHPSQFYHAALEGLLLFLVLHFLSRHTSVLRRPGVLVGVFFLGYGILRSLVEPFREPEVYVGLAHYGVTMGIALSIPMIVLGAGLIIHGYLRLFIAFTLRESDAPVVVEEKPGSFPGRRVRKERSRTARHRR